MASEELSFDGRATDACLYYEHFPFTPGFDSRVCLLSGTKIMAYEDTLYLIGHFWSRATLEPILHQARVKTRVSRVETHIFSLKL